MAQQNAGRLLVDDLRGGRNGYDPPTALAANQCVEAINVDWRSGKCLGRRRAGTADSGITNPKGGTYETSRFLFRHVPGATETAAELWKYVVDPGVASTFQRLAAGTAWADVAVVDTWGTATGTGSDYRATTFNGKAFFAADTNVNYLHCWDGTLFRRVGITVPAAATVADTGAGAYAATIRYYKVAYTVQVSGTTTRRSELSASVSFTPSGGGTAARVTKPAATSPTCGETHWELYGSPDNIIYYLLATTAVGTTTYDDSTAPGSYTGLGPPVVGTNTPPPSCKYLIAANNRLVMVGAYETTGGETTPKANRVWFTPVLGSADIGDDERVPTNNYLDLNENGGKFPTGIAQLYGDVYVFMNAAIWLLTPTGNVDAPFSASEVSQTVGALGRTIVSSEDTQGRPALYFANNRGFYRLGVGGLEEIGRHVKDLWDATTQANKQLVFGLEYPDARQVWWWVTSGSTTMVLVYDIPLSAWSVYQGAVAKAKSAVLFSGTPGASMSLNLVPYIAGGVTGGTADTLTKCDTGSTDAQDTGNTGITATITLKEYALGEDEHLFSVSNPILTMTTGANITAKCLYRPNYGGQSDVSDTLSAVAVGSETRVRLVFDGLQTAGIFSLQPILSNTDTTGGTWTMDRLLIRYQVDEAAP